MQEIIVKEGEYDTSAQVSTEEWKQILTNSDFMSNNYKYVLTIFFLEPDHKATCKYLANKYNTTPTSISGLITQFSSKVQQYLNRFEFVDEHGKSKVWPVTMVGEQIAGGVSEWTLRDELVEAMQELNFVENSELKIPSLQVLVNYINNDLSDFTQRFAQKRKSLARLGRSPTKNILFKYDETDRNWAINEGGGTEIQYHIFYDKNKLYYGLGFNTQYVPFKNKKSPIAYMKPFIKAYVALHNNDYINALRNRGFELDVEINDLEEMDDDEYHLFSKELLISNETISLIDYYSIINDLKGDLFEAYKKIFTMANEITMQPEVENKEQTQPIINPLLKDIIELLESNKNLVLTGAPGTGKTYLAKQVAKAVDAEYKLVQFHPSYDYTDFVEGLRPVQNDDGEVGFELRDGIFKSFCKEALKYQKHQLLNNFEDVYSQFIDDIAESGLKLTTPSFNNPFNISVNSRGNITATPMTDSSAYMTLTKSKIQSYLETGKVFNWKPYLVPVCEYIEQNYNLQIQSAADRNKKFIIILDEINRAEISKVLGELFFSIDPGYRGEKGKVVTQYANLQNEEDVFHNGFYIPDNVYIIGTMNDIDRSVESFDFAMRRRFAWKEIKANDTLYMWSGHIDKWKEKAEIRLQALNKAIESIQGLSSAYHIGPAYFLKLADYDGDFDKLWSYHLQSLLFEYLRGYPDAEEQLLGLKDAYNLQVRRDDARSDG